MKKTGLGLVSLMVSLLVIGGCSNNRAQTDTSKSSSTVESSLAESSTSKQSSSKEVQNSADTSQSTANSSNSSAFSLMVEASQSQLPALKEQMGEMYKDITITEGENQTLILTYTLSETPAVAIDLDAMKPTLAKGMKSMMDSANSMFGDVKIQVIYLNPDGSEIGNVTITQEDIDAISNDAS